VSNKVAILGAGSWGTAFSIVLADGGNDATTWGTLSAPLHVVPVALWLLLLGGYGYVAVRSFRRPLGLVETLVLVVVVPTSIVLPDGMHAASSWSGTLALAHLGMSVVLTWAPTELRVMALAPGAVGYLVASVAVGAPLGEVGGQMLLCATFSLSGGAFLDSLVRTTRAHDVAEVEILRTQVEVRTAIARARAAERMRRVLHDDVLSALRAVAELPADDERYAVAACAQAVASIDRELEDAERGTS